MLEAALFFAAYGGMTVEQVQDNLARRRALLELVIAGQGMPPDDLKARFMETFPLR
jgi:ATP:corrinoid adenosyltransferase